MRKEAYASLVIFRIVCYVKTISNALNAALEIRYHSTQQFVKLVISKDVVHVIHLNNVNRAYLVTH